MGEGLLPAPRRDPAHGVLGGVDWIRLCVRGRHLGSTAITIVTGRSVAWSSGHARRCAALRVCASGGRRRRRAFAAAGSDRVSLPASAVTGSQRRFDYAAAWRPAVALQLRDKESRMGCDWHNGPIARAAAVDETYRNTQAVRRFLAGACGGRVQVRSHLHGVDQGRHAQEHGRGCRRMAAPAAGSTVAIDNDARVRAVRALH